MTYITPVLPPGIRVTSADLAPVLANAGSGYERLNSPTVRVSVSKDMFYAFALSPDAGKH